MTEAGEQYEMSLIAVAQRFGVQLPPRRAADHLQKPTISRRRRSTATPGWAGRLAQYGFPIDKNGRRYGTEPRAGVIAQRGGHKAGEPVSGVWGRFAASSGR